MASSAVTVANRESVTSTSAVLADAFEHDLVMGWLVTEARRRTVAYRRFFEFESRHHALHFNDSMLATTNNQVVGAALVLPPGSWRTPFSRQVRHGYDFTTIFRTRLPHALLLQTRMERHHPRAPHYYLPFIGVARTARGRGVGNDLLRALTTRWDADQMPAYLEATSPDNARLYRRHGFETLGFLTVRDCPPLERMWRAPTREQRGES